MASLAHQRHSAATVQPQTAPKIPPVSALLFKIIRFWLTKRGGIRHQGQKYIWKPARELQAELAQYFDVRVSLSTVERHLRKLVAMGLLIREQLRKHEYRRYYFYRLGDRVKTCLGMASPPDETSPAASETRNVTPDGSHRNPLQKKRHTRAVGFGKQPKNQEKDLIEYVGMPDRPKNAIQIGRYLVLDDGMFPLSL